MASQIKEYKVIIYQESLLGSLIFGESKVNPDKFTDFLNEKAKERWKVISVEKETRRMLLFFSREAFLVILERDKY